MTYLTPDDLLTLGARELAQLATPDQYPVVDTDLLTATLQGADRSAWTAEEVTAADAALIRIETAISDAEAAIDAALASAGYILPLASAPGRLATVARDIARYRLYDEALAAEHPAHRAYRDATVYLDQLARGQIRLSTDAGGAVQGFEPGRDDWSRTKRGW